MRFVCTSLTILVLVTFLIQPIMVFATEASLTGIFVWRHGDDQQGQPIDRYFLQQGNDELQIDISQVVLGSAGGARALDGRLVRIEFVPVLTRTMSTALQVTVITPLDRSVRPRAVIGSQPWLTIMCKFNDVATEPRDYSYFANMYGDTYPGLNHYWQEVSLNNINIDGSGTAGTGWYTLPQNRAYYVDANGDGTLSMEFSRAANDCTAAADADVDFSPYVGINLMFNSDLDGYAWGGGLWMTLDGVSKFWNMTWEPPWGYAHITVMSHEMGHGFGLPHSSGQYGQTYDNAWDVMSNAWYNCTDHATYGCLGQHTIAYHKDMLGWIAAGDKVTVSGARVMRIDYLAKTTPDYYHMAKIPITGTTFYTVEVRKQVGYDAKLPAKAVIIHEVDPARSRDAQVIDSDGNGFTYDAGAQWVVGEQFVSGTIKVDVHSEYTDGFKVLIRTVDKPVVWGNVGVAGATITYTGGSTTADAYGDYAFAVDSGWSGSIVVSKEGSSFSPTIHSLSAVTSDQDDVDFVHSTEPRSSVSIAGNAGIASATIAYTGGSTTSNINGDYLFVVDSGWSGTITPSKSHYRFTPASISITNATSDSANNDIVAALNQQRRTFRSTGWLDGTLTESLRLNSLGATATNRGVIAIGDTNRRQQRKGLLSFDTSAIPASATITKVTLQLTTASVTGRNPLSTHGNILIDVRNGWFGSVKSLQASDFHASASLNNVGRLSRQSSTRYGTSWTSGMTTRINKGGETQIRLRFGKKNDGDAVSDTINFYDGSASVTRQPALIVEYTAP